jgi:hypothetical protein
MNQEIKAQWVADLRSGEFPQGRRALRKTVNPDTGKVYADGKARFCCLGVLCERAVEAGIITRGAEGGYTVATNDWNNLNGLLPASVARWAGLTKQSIYRSDLAMPISDLEVTFEGKQTTLACLNDGSPGVIHRQNFATIADVIESQL